MINVRIDGRLWDLANAHGADPEQIKARGYKLTANQVAIAALVEAFPQSADSTGAATA
jgi:hypothetical protein